jgi:dipeptidyl aminopeptidase/acylaminoacyl peptidase
MSPRREAWISALAVTLMTTPVAAQGTRADYERAEQLLAANARRLVFNMDAAPNWIGDADRFWYLRTSRAGRTFVLVDPAGGRTRPAFDHAALASGLGRASGKTYSADRLPFETFAFSADARSIDLEVERQGWRCDLSSYACTSAPRRLTTELRSPDGKWIAFVKNYNLHIRPAAGGPARPLTTDGEEAYYYATAASPSSGGVTAILTGEPRPISARWSPDSKRLLTFRLDERRVLDHVVVQSVRHDGVLRPQPIKYKYTLPGDPDQPLAQLLVVDIDTARITTIDHPPLMTFGSPIGSTSWSADSRRVYFVDEPRAWTSARLKEADARTGATRQIFEEEARTYLQLSFNGPPNVRVLDGSADAVWFSERDGWGHLYLIDTRSGAVRNQITKGQWVVRELLHVDESGRWVYFTAGGRETGRDPYYRHLYRAQLDGSAIELLTPEDAEHVVRASPSGRFFVDTFSRVDLPPVSVLRGTDGKIVRELEKADVSDLLKTGWKFPERFTVKGRDGKTDIYGAVFRPTTFSDSRKYPIVDDIYPGPHNSHTPKAFDQALGLHANSIAELGFVVVTVDGMGTCCRSKAFHDISYRNLADAGGLEDHIIAIKWLASKYRYLDVDKVGIFGHSAGGYASAHAILRYPDFYKVCVSSAGNHDARTDKATWVERWMGLPVGEQYTKSSNVTYAANLKGKLLLVHGELDDNVHPGSTIQLVDALIKANKDFDLLILPNRNHGQMIDISGDQPRVAAPDNYFLRKRWDYFVRHLLGVDPPPYEIGRPKPSTTTTSSGQR